MLSIAQIDMNSSFDPQRDFVLPIGPFAERLLGRGVKPEWREQAATIQAHLIVAEKYLPVPDNLSPEDSKKYKNDALFKLLKTNTQELHDDLNNIVPAGIDLEQELVEARKTVDAARGVPNVPPFGLILSKFMPRDTINTCLQTQAGLRIMAIIKEWPEHEKIVPARVFDTDPAGLQMVQTVLNKTHETYLAKKLAHTEPEYAHVMALSVAEVVADQALLDAQEKFHTAGQDDAYEVLSHFTQTHDSVARELSLQESYARYRYIMRMDDPAGSPSPGLGAP